MAEEKKTYKFVCVVCGYEVEVDTPELPEDDPAPIRQWVEGILYGREIPFDLKAARDLTELMENAYIADATGHEVKFG